VPTFIWLCNEMPRRRADKVIEHRISLSDGLHKEVKQVIASNKISSQVSMVGNGAKSVMNVAAVGAIGAVAYLGVKAYAEAKGVSEQIKGALNKAWDWGFGVETNADGSIVPTTVTTTDAWGNEKVVVNRINEVPVLGRVWPIGGLFQWGMELGAANNPFSDTMEEGETSFIEDALTFDWEEEQKVYESSVNPEYDPSTVAAEKARRQQEREDAWTFENLPVDASSQETTTTGTRPDGTFVLIPDDSQSMQTAWEWAVWTGRKSDYTDLGRRIDWRMSYAQYRTWYNAIDFTGLGG
jgi:hypothetical protein